MKETKRKSSNASSKNLNQKWGQSLGNKIKHLGEANVIM